MLYRVLMLVLICSSMALSGSEDLKVRVNLLDGGIAEGTLLKMNTEGVEINPGTSVKFRFIPAARIRSVEFIDLNKTVDFPLDPATLPTEIAEYEPAREEVEGEFPRFAGLGKIGYGLPGGDYYEGFDGGLAWGLGIRYYFPDSDPTAGRFLMGFTYGHLSSSGDRIYGLEPTLSLNEYSFEFGRTTSQFQGGHYLYMIMGIVVVTNTVEVPIQSVNFTYDETKAAIRLEGGGAFHIAQKLSLPVSLGYDIVLSSKSSSSSSYSYSGNPAVEFAGGIFNMSVGLIYGF
jgi:hypothetical protein